ncbi:MAG: TraR/DksA C4-type zinc finger protein [Phycisphaerales bacterium]|nr:MAG: TraR/DksA C4-type zinc finger protein [Phycisphaerales bacterium]
MKRAARTAAVREKTNTKVATKAGRARVTAEKTDTASHESSSTLSVIPFPGQEQPTPKTRLTPKQLEEFKRLLLEKRAELAGDVSHLAREMIDRNSQGPNEHTTMPIHMADVGSDNWEKEFTFGLIANEHERMREIDEALKRIEDGTYGVCLATHRRISVSRLRAKPWAKYCIEYARAREEGRAL